MFEEEILEELVEYIVSWGTFYIISCDESMHLALKFAEMLDRFDIDNAVMEKDTFDLDDAIATFVISKVSGDDWILEYVQLFKVNGMKVYVACSDMKVDFVQFCDEVFIMSNESFDDDFLRLIESVEEKIKSYIGDDSVSVDDVIPMATYQDDVSINKKDVISILLLFTPFYFCSFMYMGFVGQKESWKVMGIIYLIPLILCILAYFGVMKQHFMMFLYLFVVLWILALIHGLLVRNDFLTRKAVLELVSRDDETFEYLYDEISER